MNDWNNRIDAKLDHVVEKLEATNIILARNTASLEAHMEQTMLLKKEIQPLKKHVELVNAAAKVLSALGALVIFLHKLNIFKI